MFSDPSLNKSAEASFHHGVHVDTVLTESKKLVFTGMSELLW